VVDVAPEASEQSLPAWAVSPPSGREHSDGRRWRLSLLDSTILSNTLICTGAAIAEPLVLSTPHPHHTACQAYRQCCLKS
jgi:hypothetical protein